MKPALGVLGDLVSVLGLMAFTRIVITFYFKGVCMYIPTSSQSGLAPVGIVKPVPLCAVVMNALL